MSDEEAEHLHALVRFGGAIAFDLGGIRREHRVEKKSPLAPILERFKLKR